MGYILYGIMTRKECRYHRSIHLGYVIQSKGENLFKGQYKMYTKGAIRSRKSRKTEFTMAKRKQEKRTTTIYKTLHIKPKIKQHVL